MPTDKATPREATDSRSEALDRWRRHVAACDEPPSDLAWWLWGLANDATARTVLDQLASLPKIDEVARYLLRVRILTAGLCPSLEEVSAQIHRRWGRRISRQALHRRELDLRRGLEDAFTTMNETAILRLLDERLGTICHVEDLTIGERAVLATEVDPSSPWPESGDVALVVVATLGRTRTREDGWWFQTSKPSSLEEGLADLTRLLDDGSGRIPAGEDELGAALGAAGVGEHAMRRVVRLLEENESILITESATVVFPPTAKRLGDRVLHLAGCLDIGFDEAAELLVRHHHKNRGTLANVVRDLRGARLGRVDPDDRPRGIGAPTGAGNSTERTSTRRR